MNVNQFKKRKNNLLSLTYKINVIKDTSFIISSYNNDSINVNDKVYNLPLCILGREFFAWKDNNVLNLTSSLMIELTNKFFEINKVNVEVIIIGLVRKKISHLLSLKKKCEEKKIPIDIMKFDSACRTLNILNSENRKVISILI